MEKTSNEILYDIWDKHWDGGQKLTFAGKIFMPKRMAALRETIESIYVKTAIDVGCGYGHLLTLFKNAGLSYVGIDISENSIEACKKKGLNARIGKIEKESNTYELVASEGMLEHFLNFEPFARHMMRISERYVLLMQPNHDSFTGDTLAYVTRLLRGNNIVFEYNYRIKDFINVFESNGFRVVKCEPLLLDTSRLLLFEKDNK